MAKAKRKQRHEIEILDVPASHTLEAWPYVEKWINRAVAYAFEAITGEDVRRGLFASKFKLFVITEEEGHIIGCAVTEIIAYPRKRVCNIITVAGKANTMNWWGDQMVQRLEQWAKEKDCQLISCTGRKGWMRVLGKWGFDHQRVLCTKVLDDEQRRRSPADS